MGHTRLEAVATHIDDPATWLARHEQSPCVSLYVKYVHVVHTELHLRVIKEKNKHVVYTPSRPRHYALLHQHVRRPVRGV
jgi:hypothetical protein